MEMRNFAKKHVRGMQGRIFDRFFVFSIDWRSYFPVEKWTSIAIKVWSAFCICSFKVDEVVSSLAI